MSTRSLCKTFFQTLDPLLPLDPGANLASADFAAVFEQLSIEHRLVVLMLKAQVGTLLSQLNT